jgi:hypothetical protein
MLLICLSVVLLLVSNLQAAICLAYSRSLPPLSRNVMTHLKVWCVGEMRPLTKLHFSQGIPQIRDLAGYRIIGQSK